jgi:imidazolonepropionase-like amidohydrolase
MRMYAVLQQVLSEGSDDCTSSATEGALRIGQRFTPLHHRAMTPPSPRVAAASFALVAVLVAPRTGAQAPAATAAAVPPAPVTVFRDVRVFDGRSATRSAPVTVVVRGRLVERIGATAAIPAGATVIAGGGRTLMPGLIDAHTHLAFAAIGLNVAFAGDVGYVNLVAARTANDLLMQGFTTVRDLGGPVFSLKKAIDEGLIPGPRIYPSGPPLSQTGGHSDFRGPYELSRPPNFPVSITEAIGAARIVDGEDAVLRAARENLALGATQLKLMAGGGVTSAYDPLDVAQFTEREIRAAVEAAENWGTYVTVHAYTPRAIQAAIRAGVRCIDHGHLIDEATVKMMAEKGVYWSIQPFLDDEDAVPLPPGSAARAKQLEMIRGTETAYALARKYRVRTVFGTDALFDPRLVRKGGVQLAKLGRWFPPAEVLASATSVSAEMLAMSGPRGSANGRLGVVEEGAVADLLLVDGDPLADLSLLADPQRRLLVIMKDGTIYKNALAPRAP